MLLQLGRALVGVIFDDFLIYGDLVSQNLDRVQVDR